MDQNFLIIDDDPVVRHILSSILSGLGYSSTQAASGKEGSAVLATTYGPAKTSDTVFTAAFIDLMLLDVPGTVIALEIKNNFCPNLPVILISANSEIEIKQLHGDAKYDAFLPKPFDAADVEAVLQTLKL